MFETSNNIDKGREISNHEFHLLLAAPNQNRPDSTPSCQSKPSTPTPLAASAGSHDSKSQSDSELEVPKKTANDNEANVTEATVTDNVVDKKPVSILVYICSFVFLLKKILIFLQLWLYAFDENMN